MFVRTPHPASITQGLSFSAEPEHSAASAAVPSPHADGTSSKRPYPSHNALTVDVEDYFHVSAFEQIISPADWDRMPQRVVANTMRILELFDELQVKGTFFTLGWVAERYPFLVRHIADAGHEVASHGYSHSRLHVLTPEAFRDELIRSRKLLEDLSGAPVTGYRAPSWSIGVTTLWALDVLVESGFAYDSSIFPIHHDIYGMPDANRFPHYLERENGTLLEFPPTTIACSLRGKRLNIPVAGGGYLRLLPASLVRRAMTHVNTVEGMPAVLYFHPWEIDPKQPRVKAGIKSRFRHYLNLHRMEDRLRYLLEHVRFAPMRDVLSQWEAQRAASSGLQSTKGASAKAGSEPDNTNAA